MHLKVSLPTVSAEIAVENLARSFVLTSQAAVKTKGSDTRSFLSVSDGVLPRQLTVVGLCFFCLHINVSSGALERVIHRGRFKRLLWLTTVYRVGGREESQEKKTESD